MRKHVLLFLFILCLGLVATHIPQARATSTISTFYLNSGYPWWQDNTNGMMLLPTQSSSVDEFGSEVSWAGNKAVDFGVIVYRMFVNGTYDALTVGDSEYLLFSRPAGATAEGYQTATWNCPLTDLSRQDTILLFFEARCPSDPDPYWKNLWDATPSISVWLGYSYANTTLLNVDWNFTLYTKRTYQYSLTTAYLYVGDITRNSRVENIGMDDGITTPSASERFVFGIGVGLACGFSLGFIVLKVSFYPSRREGTEQELGE